MKTRNVSIDLLRGVSIFLIIWAHVSLGWLLDEVANVTVLGTFFCISGYFSRPSSFSDTIRKKSKSLLKPWLIFSLIGYIYHMIMAMAIDHTVFRWDMILVDLIRGCDYEANIPCWFFICLFEVFLIYTLICRCGKRASTLITLCFFFVGELMLAHYINYLYLGKTAFYLLFFHTGYMIKQMEQRYEFGQQSYNIWMVISIIVSISILFIKIEYIHNQYLDWTVGYLACIMIFRAMLYLDKSVKKYSGNCLLKFAAYVGENSLTIFALHILTNDIVWRLLYPYFHTPDFMESLLYAMISLILCLPAIPVYNMLFGGPRASRIVKI